MTVRASDLLDELTGERRERPGVSTTSLNIIVYVDDAQSVPRILQRLESFGHKHPCRTILLDATHSGQSRVRAASVQTGDTVVTRSEEIVVGVAKMSDNELHSIVHDLLLPDVGSALFWIGQRVGDPRFTALSSLASTLVVDSSRAADGKSSLCELSAMEPKHAQLRDLSYLRLLPWQDMIAAFFDDAELAPELPAIARVEIAAGSDPEAYYFAGWLASRLSWKPCGRNELCNAQGETIAVDFERRGGVRRVQRVTLEGARATFCAELDPDADDLVCLTVTGKLSRERRCAPLREVDLVSLVEQAMLVPRSDDVFVEALKMARAIIDSEK